MTKKFDVYEDDIESISKFLEISTLVSEHNKDHFFNMIKERSNILLSEIDNKNKLREIEKDNYIKKILKLDKYKYSPAELKSYTLKDVKDIYDILKENNKKSKNIFNFFR
jgi:predicted transcriptional regulator